MTKEGRPPIPVPADERAAGTPSYEANHARAHTCRQKSLAGGASSMEDEALSLPTTEEGQAGVAPRKIVG